MSHLPLRLLRPVRTAAHSSREGTHMQRIASAAAVLVGVVWACSSGPSGPAGGPVSGALDKHCSLPDGGTTATVVNPADCQVTDGGLAEGYGDTLFNAEGDDDDCKY